MDIPDTVEFHDVLNHVIDWQDEKKLEFHLESWPDSRYLMIMFKRGGDSSIFHIDVMNTNRLQWIFFGRTLELSKQIRGITISFSGFHDVETLRDYIYSFFNKFITRQDIREIKIMGIVSDESLSVFPLSKFARTRKYLPVTDTSFVGLTISLDRDHGMLSEDGAVVIANLISVTQVSCVELDQFKDTCIESLIWLIKACADSYVTTVKLRDMDVPTNVYKHLDKIECKSHTRLRHIELSLDPTSERSVEYTREFIEQMRCNFCIRSLVFRITSTSYFSLRKLMDAKLDISLEDILYENTSMDEIIWGCNHSLGSVSFVDFNDAVVARVVGGLEELLDTNTDHLNNALYRKATFSMSDQRERGMQLVLNDTGSNKSSQQEGVITSGYLVETVHSEIGHVLPPPSLPRILAWKPIKHAPSGYPLNTVHGEIGHVLPPAALPRMLAWKPIKRNCYATLNMMNRRPREADDPGHFGSWKPNIKLSFMFEVLRNSSKQWAISANRTHIRHIKEETTNLGLKPRALANTNPKTVKSKEFMSNGRILYNRDFPIRVFVTVTSNVTMPKKYCIYRHQPFGKIFKAYLHHIGFSPSNVIFVYGREPSGNTVESNDTAVTLECTRYCDIYAHIY